MLLWPRFGLQIIYALCGKCNQDFYGDLSRGAEGLSKDNVSWLGGQSQSCVLLWLWLLLFLFIIASGQAEEGT